MRSGGAGVEGVRGYDPAKPQTRPQSRNQRVITQGVFIGGVGVAGVVSVRLDEPDQAVMVASRVAKGVALVWSAAVATTVRTSASPRAAHIAR